MSETPATPATPATPVVPATAPAPAPTQPVVAKKPLNAIQVIEQQIVTYFQQKEQAIANVHALDGAIQGFSADVGEVEDHRSRSQEVSDRGSNGS